jgi:hypothetical protein
MPPGSIFHHISFRSIYFAFFTFTLYHKNTKNIMLSSLSDLTFASGREGIDNPFMALVSRFFFVFVGARDLSETTLRTPRPKQGMGTHHPPHVSHVLSASFYQTQRVGHK